MRRGFGRDRERGRAARGADLPGKSARMVSLSGSPSMMREISWSAAVSPGKR
jgi:hypothetical protein